MLRERIESLAAWLTETGGAPDHDLPSTEELERRLRKGICINGKDATPRQVRIGGGNLPIIYHSNLKTKIPRHLEDVFARIPNKDK